MSNSNSSPPSEPSLAFSPKQLAALRLGSLPKYTLLMGSTQSGKTHIQRWQTLTYLLMMATPGVAGLITGVKLDSLKRNFLRKFEELVMQTPVADHFVFQQSPLMVRYLPKKIDLYCEGINESGSETKFRGLPIQVWVGDEVPLYDRHSVSHLMGRMSQGKNPRAFLTGNPESKAHWMYREIVTGSDPKWRVMNFGLDDNPTLTDEYKETIKTAFVGGEYQRMVLGEWAGDPDRMVLPEFGDAKSAIVANHPRPACFYPTLGMDLGQRDFTFGVFGYYDFLNDLIVVEDELVMKHPNTTEVAEKVRAAEKSLGGSRELSRWCDQDLRFVEDMWALHRIRFIVTRRDDKEAQINALRVLIANKKLRINPKCENLVRHLEGATWNERRTDYERTESEGHFDGVDALIYMVRNIDRTNPYPPSWKQAEVQGLFVSPRVIRKNDDQKTWGQALLRRKR